MIQTLVCCNDRDRYPAMVDPDDQMDRFVRPWFDLGIVQWVAEDTQASAERYGHGSFDTIHAYCNGSYGVGECSVSVAPIRRGHSGHAQAL